MENDDPPELPVVLLVPVRGDAVVVDQIEESGEANSALDEGGDAAVLGEAVLVVPAPVSPRHASSPGNGVVELSAEQPSRELVDLDLGEKTF